MAAKGEAEKSTGDAREAKVKAKDAFKHWPSRTLAREGRLQLSAGIVSLARR